MPANPGDVDEVGFTTIWEFCRPFQFDIEMFIQLFFADLLPEVIQITHDNTHHQVFCKMLVVIILEDKLTITLLKTDITICLPAYF